jgi:hypothetical protein
MEMMQHENNSKIESLQAKIAEKDRLLLAYANNVESDSGLKAYQVSKE